MNTFSRLLEGFRPTHYTLVINTTSRQARTFSGTVTIEGEAPHDAELLRLHAKDLAISSAQIDSQPVQTSLRTEQEELDLHKAISAGRHTVELAFSGTITDSMTGLYPCYFTLNGQDEELLATQFESHAARQVFPCIDEPAAKATFNLTLVTEPHLSVVSNTPIKHQQTGETLTTTFETTPVMSTYLLAWTSGKLAYRQATTKAGVQVRAYATTDKIAKTQFALDTAVKALDFYNDYFNLPYPLAKCDLIGLPDFSSGAMENWGCITFRESCYLVDEHSSAGTRQYVACIVAHELAHQWFGNLVTMEWWDDLWLNESFASWIEYLALDHIFPEWDMWTQFFASETSHALEADSAANIQCVRQPVNHPGEIAALFDHAIVYAKGASLLHMLHTHLGAEPFRDGLRRYMQKHQYGNATAQDLWASLSEAAGSNVGRFMQPWISQPGHPLVLVASHNNQLHLSQQRFLSNPDARAKPARWPIPLLSNLPLQTFDTAAVSTWQTDATPLLNQGRSGFYLTKYDAGLLQKHVKSVTAGRLSVLDRLGLLHDAGELAKAGQYSAVQLVELLQAFHAETQQPVWVVMAGIMQTISMLVGQDAELEPHWQTEVAALAEPHFAPLGWAAKPADTPFDSLLRSLLANLLVDAKHEPTQQQALALFAKASQPQDIPGDVRVAVLKAAGRQTQHFEMLLGWLHQQPSAELRMQLIRGLGMTTNAEHLQKLLTRLTTKDVKLQDMYYWFGSLMHNPSARPATWQWLQDNWAWITKHFTADMHYDHFPSQSASEFSTAAELRSYKTFFEPMQDHPALGRAIRKGVEGIECRLAQRDRDLPELATYLKRHQATA